MQSEAMRRNGSDDQCADHGGVAVVTRAYDDAERSDEEERH